MEQIRQIGALYQDAAKYFFKKKGTTLAAASSYYIILAFIPSFLLLVRALGPVLGSYEQVEERLITIGNNVFPHLDEAVIIQAKNLIQKMLYGTTQFTVFSTLILLYSSLAFLNSVWNSLFLITEDPKHDSYLTYLKGFALLIFTFFFLVVALFLPSIVFYFIRMIQENPFSLFLRDNFTGLTAPINFLLDLDLQSTMVRHALFFNSPLMILYFAILYRYIYSSKINFKQAFMAATNFVATLLLAKLLFFLYFENFGSNLEHQYGDLTTFITPVLWTYIVMCLFYFGFCLCHAFVAPNQPAIPADDTR